MKKTIIPILFLVLGITVFSQMDDYLKELSVPYYSNSINKSDKYLNELYPVVKCPKYPDDAAAAIAWVFNNIER